LNRKTNKLIMECPRWMKAQFYATHLWNTLEA